MPTHNLQHERTGVRNGGRVDVIDGFADPLQSGRGADGEIGHTHVIVDGTNKTNNLEVTVAVMLFVRDPA